MKELTRDDIRRLLGELDKELAKVGERAVLYVVGGANIALAFDTGRTTTDVDAVVKQGFDAVWAAAKRVADSEPGLGEDWLNSAFTGGTPDGGMSWSWMDNKDADEPSTFFEGESLSVQLASPEMMLALKTLSSRDKDLDDIYLLMRATGIHDAQGLGRNLARFTGSPNLRRPGVPMDVLPHRSDLLIHPRQCPGRLAPLESGQEG